MTVTNPNLVLPAGVGLPMAITAPGPTSELVITVPAGSQWEVVALAFLFTSSAIAANRAVRVEFDTGAAPSFAATAWDGLVVGSTPLRLHFSLGFSKPWNDQGGIGYGPMPKGLILYPGYRIRTVTVNMQTGDQYNAIMLTVK